MGLPRNIETFSEFWLIYLGEHTCVLCRVVHYVAAVVSLLILGATFWLQHWWLLMAAPIAAYGLAWFGHFVFEKNRPATWSYPWWSLCAEWRMFGLAITGRLCRHLERARERVAE